MEEIRLHKAALGPPHMHTAHNSLPTHNNQYTKEKLGMAISLLSRLRQEDCFEFKAAWVTHQDPISESKNW